ncbi:MAG TPA: extracellular solute-binding protein, partial [Jiangellaceae bacterium]|nr:extracellular solute-binding protein [Jiangellaceae bacterium]
MSRAWALAAAGALGLTACAGAGGGGDGGGEEGGETTITVATVANPAMQDIEKLLPHFEEDNPDVTVKIVTLPENELRDKVTQDIATQAGQYDVVTIGTYEVPIWAENEWLTNLDDDASQGDYDVDDLLPPVRDALTFDGSLYAVPFYGESSFLM